MSKKVKKTNPSSIHISKDTQGSLGLLALGYRGLRKWRQDRQSILGEKEGDDDDK